MIGWLELLSVTDRARAEHLAHEWRTLKSNVAQRLREADDISLVEPRLASPRSALASDLLMRCGVSQDVNRAITSEEEACQ